MLNKIKNNKGFTIVEVMIVLAIAGMIIAIVFIAVPMLKRTSRNNAIRSDAANLLSGVTEFSQNNNGMLPNKATPSASTGDVVISGVSGTSPVTVRIRPQTTVETDFASGNIPSEPGTIQIRTGIKCTNNEFGGTSNRSVVAGFVTETSSSDTAKQCMEG